MNLRGATIDLREGGALLCVALAACGTPRPDAAWSDAHLASALEASSADTRQRAAYLLSERRADDVYWPLVRTLGDPRWEVRADAALALGRVSRADARVPLAHALRDRHWWVRVSAARALGERRDATAAPFLAAMRFDENESVRMAAERALDEVRR